MLILQQVDQIAQSAFVASIGGSLDVGLFEAAAKTTADFAVFTRKYMRRKQAFAADRTQTARDRPHRIEASHAHGES